jgi:hypothetical protein
MTDEREGVLAATADALEEVFALARQLAVHGRDSPTVGQSAQALERALVLARPPFALQLFADAVLRDGAPLPLSLEAFRRCQQLVGAFARWGVQELTVEAVPPWLQLIDLAAALFSATHTNRATRAPQLRGLRFAALARAAHGPPPTELALDAHLIDQLALAWEEAGRLSSGSSGVWPFEQGRALTWRLERCLAASVTGTGRAVELAPLPWSIAQRTMAAAFRVGAVLVRLRVSPLTQRSAMHATLAFACHGLAEREGLPFGEAARVALPALLAHCGDGDCDPHRLRVCALVRAASEAERTPDALPLLPLLHAAYELERRRCPADLDFNLSRMDLQAWLASALGREVHEGWGRALLGVLGLVPVGGHVLADGRLGVVVGASNTADTWRPRVLVGGQVVIPDQPVRMHSPLGMTPWAK